MKKPKFLLKVDNNKNAKIYLNGKWIKDVFAIRIDGDIDGYGIIIDKYVRDSRNILVIEDNEIKTIRKHYKIVR